MCSGCILSVSTNVNHVINEGQRTDFCCTHTDTPSFKLQYSAVDALHIGDPSIPPCLNTSYLFFLSEAIWCLDHNYCFMIYRYLPPKMSGVFQNKLKMSFYLYMSFCLYFYVGQLYNFSSRHVSNINSKIVPLIFIHNQHSQKWTRPSECLSCFF